MTMRFVFWFLMFLIFLAFIGVFVTEWKWIPVANQIVEFILFGLLGWRVFGKPVQG